MTHYRMSDSMPSAIILLKNPRNGSLDELKIYENKNIFLNDGDEFQIRLFNPLGEKIGVQININGQYTDQYLILRPGEDVTIDRFINDKRKMIFETYKYDDGNALAKKAVANNGLVEIKFYKEYSFNTYSTYPTYPYYTTYPYYNNTNQPNWVGGTYSSSIPTFNSNTGTDTNINYSSLKETGRVEKGEQSKQKFESIDVYFQSYHFHSIDYHLIPISEKESYTKKEIREYCAFCGYRLRKNNWVYCPKCGSKI